MLTARHSETIGIANRISKTPCLTISVGLGSFPHFSDEETEARMLQGLTGKLSFNALAHPHTFLNFLGCPCTPSHTLAHPHMLLHTLAHYYTPSHYLTQLHSSHNFSVLHLLPHPYTPSHTVTHSYTSSHILNTLTLH